MTRPRIDGQITFCYTRDLAATSSFYEDVIALPLVVDQGACRIYRVAAQAYLGFCERDHAITSPDGIILTLVTEAVDEWYHYLSSLGVEFQKAPAINDEYGIYHCLARDPNGYLIEIQRFLDPGWQDGEDQSRCQAE
ncbi:MAG: VOC family protein [Anaerolineae bacterium]